MRFLFRPLVLTGIGMAIAAGIFYYLGQAYPLWNSIAQPAAYVYRNISVVARIYDSIIHFSELSRTNAELISENHALLARLSSFDALVEENADLRKALDLPQVASARLIDAGISGAWMYPEGSELIINKGRREGIEAGSIVIGPSGFLVGTIREVHERYAKVALIVDPDVQITVRTIDTNTRAIARGALAQGMNLEFISQSDEVSQGDLMVTTGSDQYPAGLPIGTIYRTHLPAGSLFKEVSVRPFFQEERFDRVFILITP